MEIESVLNEMNQLHKDLAAGILLIKSTQKESVPKAIRLGELLTWCKKQPQYGEHGKWLAFIKDRVPFSQQSVSKYMRVYELSKEGKLPDVDNVSDLYPLMGIEDQETRESLVVEAKQNNTTVRNVHEKRKAAAKDINVPSTESPRPVSRRVDLGSQNSNSEQGTKDTDKPDLPKITDHHWKLYKSRNVRERILKVLESMHIGGGLDADVPEDLDLLRTMVSEDLGRKVKKLQREERASRSP
jgi:hypothetical protein